MRIITGTRTHDIHRPANRPPADMLPDAIAKLAAERDDLARRAKEATTAIQDQSHWATARAEARKADAAAIVQATRDNKNVDNPAAHFDAVEAEIAALVVERDNLDTALAVVNNELSAARHDELNANRDKYEAKVKAAQAKLAKAADAMRKATDEAIPVLALSEWMLDGLAYNTTATTAVAGQGRYRVEDLAIALETLIGTPKED